ncbi:hypothetical protein GCM10011611_52220 [Aliidongia dinghuensis]|uniref:TNT domain-containing protein n=1 Tax=Aliidongia dinghuensis TaxID=1867774 RepID=A0A8J3E5Z5_9PROT|nr:TNT domain-containing protein [Aliidongia dinghuensis]GGF39367.1 hypothetical protein GCM10011611_52220 [Aliidongia dinghuensis]
MRHLARLSLVLLTLAGCAAAPAAQSPPPSTPAASQASTLRPDLAQQWRDPSGNIRWPAHDGFAATPVLMVLPPGLLIDRFGSDYGRFFSPKGASFAARALPYVCASLVYRVYKLDQPLIAWTGAAAPWFDQPGGATQIETDATAAQLLADRVIEPVAAPDANPCGK